MILLEGGYYIEGLGDSMVNFLKGWEDAGRVGEGVFRLL
jgi:acetoin utilization deacetylase AcuC-like enzyme